MFEDRGRLWGEEGSAVDEGLGALGYQGWRGVGSGERGGEGVRGAGHCG